MPRFLDGARLAVLTAVSFTLWHGEVVAQWQHWNTICQSAQRGGPSECMASEVVMVGPQRQRLFELTLLVRQAAQPQLVINAPFGIHVGQGLELLIDGEPGGRVPILYCAQSGCRAEMQMTSELIERMSAGHILSLVFLANGGQRVTTPVPLTGFASAYHRIKLDGDAVAATGDKDAASDPKR